MTTTRYPNGITNVSKTNPLGTYESYDPAKWYQYFDDFDNYFPGEWNVIVNGAGGARDLIDEDGGILSITNSAGDDDSTVLIKKPETLTIESGKKTIFKARFSVSDATQSDFIIGIRIAGTSVIAPSDAIIFSKDDGNTNLYFSLRKNSVATSTSTIATIADDTYIEVAFVYNGTNKVDYFVNNQKLGYLGITNLPNDEELSAGFSIQNGEAVAKTIKVDYLFVAKER
jgi:hypothetical protein